MIVSLNYYKIINIGQKRGTGISSVNYRHPPSVYPRPVHTAPQHPGLLPVRLNHHEMAGTPLCQRHYQINVRATVNQCISALRARPPDNGSHQRLPVRHRPEFLSFISVIPCRFFLPLSETIDLPPGCNNEQLTVSPKHAPYLSVNIMLPYHLSRFSITGNGSQ